MALSGRFAVLSPRRIHPPSRTCSEQVGPLAGVARPSTPSAAAPV